jgi:hypothetical protein
MSERKGIPLRCPFCAESPLLAICGRDERSGEPWVHIKSWKGNRLYVEAVVVSGVVKLKCRSCGRWNILRIVKGAPKLRELNGHPLDAL